MGVVLSGWAAPLYRPFIAKECEEAFERALENIKHLLEPQPTLVPMAHAIH